MKKMILRVILALGGLTAVGLLPSCNYDPSYYSAGGGGDYGYGQGYGYGNSRFSTSLFVSTGNPRWFYDPYTYCYYDYRSRRYYDPYLYGYYPVGYRPRPVYGVPHPHGWHRGMKHCPPPSRVRNSTLDNYRNREQLYRNSSHGWARNVGSNNAYSNPRFNPQNTNRGRVNHNSQTGVNRWNHGTPEQYRDSGNRYDHRREMREQQYQRGQQYQREQQYQRGQRYQREGSYQRQQQQYRQNQSSNRRNDSVERQRQRQQPFQQVANRREPPVQYHSPRQTARPPQPPAPSPQSFESRREEIRERLSNHPRFRQQ